jgi:pyridoxal phosphate enzyme (YggS family)
MTTLPQQVLDNLASVRKRMADACAEAQRSPDSVQLIAVTKYASPEVTRLLCDAGCRDLGESRPQSLWTKAEELAELKPQWHMIGHLQRNKVRRTLPLLSMIHSLDSMRLIIEIDQECRRNDQSISGLLEVNISGDDAKHGFTPSELPEILGEWPADSRVQIVGLMGMAGLESSLAEAQRQFAQLRELRDRLQVSAPEVIQLRELSMGMSNDFEQAIAEGSTMIRVGSMLLEGIEM